MDNGIKSSAVPQENKVGEVFTVYGVNEADVKRVEKAQKTVHYKSEGVKIFESQRIAQANKDLMAENAALVERVAALEDAIGKPQAPINEPIETPQTVEAPKNTK